jgi:hypothetical protein
MLQPKPSNLALVVGLVTGGVLIASCSSGSTTVDGRRDDVKTKAAVREVSHYETKAKTKRVCVSRNKKGKCTSYVDRPDGTKRVKVVDKPGKPALYCVELDDVNGSKSDDDVWYTVTMSTYVKAAAKDEGDKIKNMSYNHSGCWV